MPVKEKIGDEFWDDVIEGHKDRDWYKSTRKYCYTCGSENETYVEKAGFSTKTGNQLYIVYKICPKKRWWNFHDAVRGLPSPPKELE